MTMDSVREWFKKVVTPMLDPETSLFCVGTPMSHTDLYQTEMLSEKALNKYGKVVYGRHSPIGMSTELIPK